MRRSSILGSLRELGTVGVVAGLCGAYAGLLIMISSVLGTNSAASGTSGFGALLGVVSTVFILVALYVSAVVITNCIDTVIAGMLGRIALLRLLGASGRWLRTSTMRRTAGVACLGAVAGVLAGCLGAYTLRTVLVSSKIIRPLDYPLVSPWLTAVIGAVVLMALGAGWIGSRAVLRVSPAQGMVGAIEPSHEPRPASRRRTGASLALIGCGGLLLGLSMWLGEHVLAIGFLVAFFGAAASATGLLVGARLVIPAAVALLGRLLGARPPSVVARRNAIKNPLRTTRSTMGLVIGVTLVTTFASGLEALRRSVDSWELSPARRQEAQSWMSTMSTILVVIVIVSAVIAAVGFVNTMSLTVIQRHREIGLLRALGFTRRQVRSMIVRESAALAGSAVVLGLGLGMIYGSVGAQALVGAQTPGFVWGIPWLVLGSIAVAAVVLVLLAALAPARRAVRVLPVEALRMT